MRLTGIFLPLLFVISSAVLFAQDLDRPDNSRRARPELEEEDAELFPSKGSISPFLLRSPISTETGIFLNRNLIDEPKAGALPQNESSIAINPLDPKILISSAVDARGAWVYRSTDGGKSWTNKRLAAINTNWQSGNDPSTGFDYLGNGYVMFGAFPSTSYTGESGVYICKTTDNGETWSQPMIVIEHRGTMTPDSAFEDKYYIQADNSASSSYRGYLYTPWKRVIDADSSTQIVVSRSTDGGASWSTPVRVSPRKSGTSTDTTFGQSFPLTTTGPDGTLYVVWNDGPIRSLGFSRSTDGGLTFSEPTYPVQGYPTLGTARTVKRSGDTNTYHVLKETFRAETYPTMMADNSDSPRRGWLYLAWAAGLHPDIYFIRSTDKGVTWSEPRVIQSVTTNDQWWPWLSVDQTNGDIAVMYSDSRNDPANITIDTYVSYSSDGGDTWIDRRATDAVSDFRTNPYVDHIFAGDYSGNAFFNGRIYPSFLDTRDDNDVYTAVMSIRQPLPVEDLVVRGTVADLTRATLTWRNPAFTSVFDKPITDYSLVLYRDSVQLAVLPSGTTTYSESGLTLDKTYAYEVRVATETDTSAPRTVTFRSGQAKLPGVARIDTARGNAPQVAIDVLIPTVRADSSTALGNVAGYRLYRDGVKVGEGTLSPSDTGQIVTVTDVPAERGYYRYYVTVLDGAEPPNESLPSDTVLVYGGSLDRYVEMFDAAPPRFYMTGKWGITSDFSFTPTNSLTDSPTGLYRSLQNTFAQIYPVAFNGPLDLRFVHVGLIDPTDTAFVEVSFDGGTTWRTLARYDSTSYPGWGSGPDAEDWHAERLRIDPPSQDPGQVGIVRFRLRTSDFRNTDGWYIDDISFDLPGGVEGPDRAGVEHSIRPNPVVSVAVIEYRLKRPSDVVVRIVDLLGREVERYDEGYNESGEHSLTIDCRDLATGAYYYEIVTSDGISRGRMLFFR